MTWSANDTLESEHTGRVASKYDSYWASRLAQIRAAVERAAVGLPAEVQLPGLARVGQRQSWRGVAEVCRSELTHSSMAHATSLGRVIAASGICSAWPQATFRLTIATDGDILAISADQRHPGEPGRDTATPEETAEACSRKGAVRPASDGSAAGGTRPGNPRIQVPDRVAADRFYQLLGQLADILGGPRYLQDCRGGDGWPHQGVYFFFEPGETRADGSGRIVRVGTHALIASGQATLWGRLRQHRGHLGGRHPGGGNHRASVFRRHVGAAIIRRENPTGELLGSWLDRHGPWPGQAQEEQRIEQAVSVHIRAMPLLWLAVPGRADRARVERNSIALTSCLGQDETSPAPTSSAAAPPGPRSTNQACGTSTTSVASPNPASSTCLAS